LIDAGFGRVPEVLLAEDAFEAIFERGVDGVVRLLAAPRAGAGSEVVDGDEHEELLCGQGNGNEP
jgi:hypothetical protein